MRPDGERITANEERISELRRDLDERVNEERRIRERIHKLEGLVGMLVDHLNEARRAEDRQYRRLEVRLQLLTFVVAAAAIVVPIALAVIHAK